MARPLHFIAQEIRGDWKKVNYAAKPYLNAMATLDGINSNYGLDSARSVVLYFLNNAQTWRGDVARRVKAELKAMVSGKPDTTPNPYTQNVGQAQDAIGHN